jgi:hypothetical protein
MAEAFVRTINSDYVRVSPCRMHRPSCTSYQLGYNDPHKALGYRSLHGSS